MLATLALAVCCCDAFRCGHLPAIGGGRLTAAAKKAPRSKKHNGLQLLLQGNNNNNSRKNNGRNDKNSRPTPGKHDDSSRRLLPSRSLTDPLHKSRFLSTTTSTTTTLRGGAAILATATTSPALSVWLGPALACALSYALYNLFIKKASSSIDPILGGVLLQIVAAVLGALLLAVKQTTATGTASLQWSRLGVSWAIAAGAAVGMAEILSFIISSLGVPASKSIPTIIGGSVLIGTLLGVAWLGERLTLKGWSGIVMIAIGIALVGMDPGSSASMH